MYISKNNTILQHTIQHTPTKHTRLKHTILKKNILVKTKTQYEQHNTKKPTCVH